MINDGERLVKAASEQTIRAERNVSIPDDIARFEELGLLDALLEDRTTGGHIIWATSSYVELGEGYGPTDAITPAKITGAHAGVIRRRAVKDMQEQSALTRSLAEVFTPTWVVRFMIDEADWAWRQSFLQSVSFDYWLSYVQSRRLEIACGEAPFLVNRYDAADGTVVALAERTGILSRKLALVNEHTADRNAWLHWALKALRSTFGYEYQGDNLLIARVNVLRTMEDFLEAAGFECFSAAEYRVLVDAITWNIWQMDGLTNCVPFSRSKVEAIPDSLFSAEPADLDEKTYGDCRIRDWETDRTIDFNEVRGANEMKFDYVIGNPPYQEETEGTSDKPVYHMFMDSSFKVSREVELITPARFLFNAGKTPANWNRKMLDDKHFKVLKYWSDSRDVFPQNDIKGGIAISLRDGTRVLGPIGTFSPYEEVNSILHKVSSKRDQGSLDDLLIQQTKWNLENLYSDHPECRDQIGSQGHERRLTTSIFTTVDVFRENANPEDVTILGLINNHRVKRYIDPKYIDKDHGNIDKFKVILPKSNGSGAFGETLSSPIVGSPSTGYTQSFISFGAFDDQLLAENLLKYIKTKFARTLLGTLKITQDNNKGKWVNVPLQDFTSDSDIDWSQSVSDIDTQLYKKYGLSEDEIDFIETHVKPME